MVCLCYCSPGDSLLTYWLLFWPGLSALAALRPQVSGGGVERRYPAQADINSLLCPSVPWTLSLTLDTEIKDQYLALPLSERFILAGPNAELGG